jgi:nucleoside-diphosphate-sugar epimerase
LKASHFEVQMLHEQVRVVTNRRKVLITGAGGTLGRATAKVLVERGYEVSGFGLGEQYYRQQPFFKALQNTGAFKFEIGSILDRFAVAAAMRDAAAVVHLAAMIGAKRAEAERLRCFDINVNGTNNVLAAAVGARVGRFVMMSSSAVYGGAQNNPIGEDAAPGPSNLYGVTKLAAEELTRGYAQLHPALRFTIIRLFNTYGDDVAGHIAYNAFASRVTQGLPPRINGDGEQRRCYVHADDVAEAIATIIERPIAENGLYNLGNPAQVLTLNELARKVIDILAPDSGLVPEAGKASPEPGEPRDCVADTGRAARELDYQPRITVEQGLHRLAERLKTTVV